MVGCVDPEAKSGRRTRSGCSLRRAKAKPTRQSESVFSFCQKAIVENSSIMYTLFHLQQNNPPKERAQAIVEFAIVLPILMMLLVGILEVGRMIFIYSAVNNASREAARYASAVGLADGGVYNKYQYCSEIRNVARRSAFFMNLPDANITINYDDGPAYVNTPFASCPAGTTANTSLTVDSGQRVTVTVNATYSPMVTLLPINSRPFSSRSSRTIVGVLELTYP